MIRNKSIIRVCLIVSVLVFALLSLSGCAEKDKESLNQTAISPSSEKVQSDLEQLKSEKDRIKRRITYIEDSKLKSTQLSGEDKIEELRKLEELNKRLLEESKKIEEKIKSFQGGGN